MAKISNLQGGLQQAREREKRENKEQTIER
jgi:hypothetical protein